MDWEECIEEAKMELGYSQGEWIEDWDEVITTTKQKYWANKTFKDLKEQTIENAQRECLICNGNKTLTAHHINYGTNETTICVCKKCHKIIHNLQKTYGFVMQCLLTYYNEFDKPNFILPNMFRPCLNLQHKLIKKINELEDLEDDTRTDKEI